jgi:hypothetical protein
MFAPRPIHLFICLIACSIALTIAGCGTTSVQGKQDAAGGEPARPTMVLVDDMVFSPDVAVIDREFATRLARKLGDSLVTNDVIKGITIKRVNDEIVATVVVILHQEAGFKAQPGSDLETAPKDGALVIAGQLRAAEQDNRAQRKPVGFGGDAIADVTLSQVSGGASKQLTAFTTQAQSGRQSDAAIFGADAAERNAQIAAVIGSMNAPDVKLSPDVEVQARALGRAIADKIVGYAVQRGWAHKAYLSAPVTTAKPLQKRPTEKKLRKLPVAAATRDGMPAPPKPFPCDAFTRTERGYLYVKGPITVDIGNAKGKTLQNQEIPPGFFTVGGVDLYAAIQKKCVGHRDR